TINGETDLRLLDPALGYPFAEGIARLELNSAGQDGTLRVDGSVRVDKGAYIGPGVNARGLDLTARVHADPGALRITSITAHLPQGGEVAGEVLLAHWLPPSSGPVMEPTTTQQTAKGPSRKKSGMHARGANPEQPSKTAAAH